MYLAWPGTGQQPSAREAHILSPPPGLLPSRSPWLRLPLPHTIQGGPFCQAEDKNWQRQRFTVSTCPLTPGHAEQLGSPRRRWIVRFANPSAGFRTVRVRPLPRFRSHAPLAGMNGFDMYHT